MFTGLRIHDTQCGFKLFRMESARRAFEMQRVEGFGFDPELLFLIERTGGKIVEVPVRWNHDAATKVRFPIDPIRMFADLVAAKDAGDGNELFAIEMSGPAAARASEAQPRNWARGPRRTMVESRAARGGDAGGYRGGDGAHLYAEHPLRLGLGRQGANRRCERAAQLGGHRKIIGARQLVVSRSGRSSAERVLPADPDRVVRAELHDAGESSGGVASRKNCARADCGDPMLPAGATADGATTRSRC